MLAVVSIEVERLDGVELRRRVNGSRLFQGLVEGSIEPAAATKPMASQGLDGGPWMVVTVDGDPDQLDIDRVHAVLVRDDLPHLLARADPGLILLVSEGGEEVLETLASSVRPREQTGTALPRLGISRTVTTLARIPDALREARWALETADPGQLAARYGERAATFAPSTLAEAESVVERVLGAVLRYDQGQDGSGALMTTLSAYFEANRSVQQCADELGVHKQTVMYRLKRVEAVSNRRLQKLSDLTDLYLAYRAWRQLYPPRHSGNDA
ncbi:PucR family transcriptional regulator [Nocardioides sambongensis]|uniref:PucR family transcriptional regulator n=1 Tax=Nocardioides sambongensis TaxID=2589074 RepID=UPI0015E8525F|nr:helix-turn-helix domain-containing protein [Nocardioides sambongensis]